MKENIKIFITVLCFYIITVSTGILIVLFIADINSFNNVKNSDCKNPWYGKSIIVEPYTNFRLFMSGNKPEYYITTNVAGDVWICETIKFGDKQYWTIDYTIKHDTITTNK